MAVNLEAGLLLLFLETLFYVQAVAGVPLQTDFARPDFRSVFKLRVASQRIYRLVYCEAAVETSILSSSAFYYVLGRGPWAKRLGRPQC